MCVVQKLLTSQVEIEKGSDYDYLRPWLMNGLLVSKGRKWKARRRMISPAFHFSIIEDFVPVFESCAQRLTQRLQEQQQQDGQIDHLLTPVERCALEVICQTSIGVSLSSIEKGEEGRVALDYSGSLATVTHATFVRSLNPLLALDFVFSWTRLGREYWEKMKKLVTFMDKVVQQRIDQHRERRQQQKLAAEQDEPEEEKPYFYGKLKVKRAFLDLLIDTMLLQEDEQSNLSDDQRLDQQGIREEVNTFTFEGFDTTSTTLFSVLYLLGRCLVLSFSNSKVMQKGFKLKIIFFPFCRSASRNSATSVRRGDGSVGTGRPTDRCERSDQFEILGMLHQGGIASVHDGSGHFAQA